MDDGGRGRWASRVGCALLLAAVAVLPWQGVRWAGGLSIHVNEGLDRPDGVLVADLLLVLAAVAGVITTLRRRRIVVRPSRLLLLGFALLLVGGLLGLVFAEDPDSAKLLSRSLAAVLVCVVGVWSLAPGERVVRLAGIAFVAGATASTLLGIAALFFDDVLSTFESGTGRSIGLAANAGAFATLTAMAGAVALVALVDAPTRRLRIVWGSAAAVLGAGLLASGSRGVVLTSFVVVALLVWRAARSDEGRLAAGISGAVALVVLLGALGLVPMPALDRLLDRPDAVGNTSDRSTELRFDQIPAELDRRGYESLLLGSGLQDLEPTDADLRHGVLVDPHTAHLEVWIGLGLLGFTGWVLVAFATIAPGVRLVGLRRRLLPAETALAAASVAYLSFVLSAFTVNNVWSRYLWLVVAFAALLASRWSPSGEVDTS